MELKNRKHAASWFTLSMIKAIIRYHCFFFSKNKHCYYKNCRSLWTPQYSRRIYNWSIKFTEHADTKGIQVQIVSDGYGSQKKVDFEVYWRHKSGDQKSNGAYILIFPFHCFMNRVALNHKSHKQPFLQKVMHKYTTKKKILQSSNLI